MNRKQIFTGMILIAALAGRGQETVCIDTRKTASLIFPAAIRHVDRGSAAVLAEPASENILLLKAATEAFAETNLTVVTEDGQLYAFTLCAGEPVSRRVALPRGARPPVAARAAALADNPPLLRHPFQRKWGMSLRLKGIYTGGDVLYFQLELDNRSSLDYEVDYLQASIRDRRGSRRTARQEVDLPPLAVAGRRERITAGERRVWVLALPRLTLAEGKTLVIRLGEKNGGRQLSIYPDNRLITRARKLP